MKLMNDEELIVYLSSQLTAALIRIQELEEENKELKEENKRLERIASYYEPYIN